MLLRAKPFLHFRSNFFFTLGVRSKEKEWCLLKKGDSKHEGNTRACTHGTGRVEAEAFVSTPSVSLLASLSLI
jgi:hypothetical protein